LAYAPFWFAEAQITNIGPSGLKKELKKCRRHDMIIAKPNKLITNPEGVTLF
jgi:hypothetical protein